MVTHTPDAPTEAVVQLTLGALLTASRGLKRSFDSMKQGRWLRVTGKDIRELSVGIIGVGRIGWGLANILQKIGCKHILLNDVIDLNFVPRNSVFEIASKHEIYRRSDVLTLHTPLTTKTQNLVMRDELRVMKPDVVILNFARGGIINEDDLLIFLQENPSASAYIDVFVEEPYSGPLLSVDNAFLSAHLGSMTSLSREQMESEAVQDALNILNGLPPKNPKTFSGN